MYTHASSTSSSYSAQLLRLDKGQPQQNRLATPGARSIASAATKHADWDEIKKTLSEKEPLR